MSDDLAIGARVRFHTANVLLADLDGMEGEIEGRYVQPQWKPRVPGMVPVIGEPEGEWVGELKLNVRLVNGGLITVRSENLSRLPAA